MSDNIKIEGIDELILEFDEIAKCENLYNAVQKACLIVEADAKKRAPKDLGALRRSIQSQVNDSDNEIIGEIWTDLEYGVYQEYGTGLFAENGGRNTPWVYVDSDGEGHKTVGNKPQPYMRPALNANTNKITEMIKEGITNG